MGESVKYYLADGMPFIMEVEVGCEIDGIKAIGSSERIVTSVGSRKVRCINCDNGGAVAEDLSNRLALATKFRPLKWWLDVSCYRARKSWDGVGQTEFRLTFTRGSDVKEFLGKSSFLQAELFAWQYHGVAQEPFLKFTTAEMPVTEVQDGNQLVFVDSSYNPVIDGLLPRSICMKYRSVTGKINLVIIDKIYQGRGEQNRMSVCKRMLEQELCTDVVIVPYNKVEIKCHSAILAAHSDVFETMFRTTMQESQKGRINLPHMSEDGVRAFLAYLYHWDTSKAEECCSVAMELLMVGHMYNIRVLEDAMRKILLTKHESWYDVHVAEELFCFVRNLDVEWNVLRKKAVMILEMGASSSKNLVDVQKLFQGNPQAAMDFCN